MTQPRPVGLSPVLGTRESRFVLGSLSSSATHLRRREPVPSSGTEKASLKVEREGLVGRSEPLDRDAPEAHVTRPSLPVTPTPFALTLA